MDRVTFSKKLVEAKKQSGVGFTSLVKNMQVMPVYIYRLENGLHNFMVNKCLPYLHCVNHILELRKNEQVFVIYSGEDLVNWELHIRGDLTKASFARTIGYTRSQILYIETGKCSMTIDMMLKIAEVYGYTIEIVPNNQQCNHEVDI